MAVAIHSQEKQRVFLNKSIKEDLEVIMSKRFNRDIETFQGRICQIFRPKDKELLNINKLSSRELIKNINSVLTYKEEEKTFNLICGISYTKLIKKFGYKNESSITHLFKNMGMGVGRLVEICSIDDLPSRAMVLGRLRKHTPNFIYDGNTIYMQLCQKFVYNFNGNLIF
jgi:hypothetical protein